MFMSWKYVHAGDKIYDVAPFFFVAREIVRPGSSKVYIHRALIGVQKFCQTSR